MQHLLLHALLQVGVQVSPACGVWLGLRQPRQCVERGKRAPPAEPLPSSLKLTDASSLRWDDHEGEHWPTRNRLATGRGSEVRHTLKGRPKRLGSEVDTLASSKHYYARVSVLISGRSIHERVM